MLFKSSFLFVYLLTASISYSIKADQTAGVGEISNGYKMGQLTKFSEKGIFRKSGEGELTMGVNSTPWLVNYDCGTRKDPQTCSKQLNPWEFSSEKNMIEKINQYAGKNVVIHYTEAAVGNSFNFDTDYLALDVEAVNKELQPKPCLATHSAGGVKSDGFRIGRIVKLSHKGTVNKSYESWIQIGDAGNQFMAMSIKDEVTFLCAKEFLKSGKKATILYNQSLVRNPLSQDTTYDMLSITLLE